MQSESLRNIDTEEYFQMCAKREQRVFLGWLGQLVNDATADQSNFLPTRAFDRIILSTARCVFTRTTTRDCRETGLRKQSKSFISRLYRPGNVLRTKFSDSQLSRRAIITAISRPRVLFLQIFYAPPFFFVHVSYQTRTFAENTLPRGTCTCF